MLPFQVANSERSVDTVPKLEASYISLDAVDIKAFLSPFAKRIGRQKCDKNSQQIVAFVARFLMLV